MTPHGWASNSGRRVRELRVQQGLSQTELARRAGMTQPAVARFEAGGTVPTFPLLERLARSLGVELTVQLAPSSSVPDSQDRQVRNLRLLLLVET